MPSETINGIEIYYEVHGKGEPVLFLHGGGGEGSNWKALAPEWPFQIVAPDLPEHGRSTGRPGPWTHRAAAGDMLALMDRLGITKIKAIGISMGGNALLHMATMQPDRVEAMVLASATPYFGDEARKFMREFPMDTPLFRRIKAMADGYDDMNFTPPLLGTIRARTLIVYGDRDPLYPVEMGVGMYRAIRGSELWVVPGGGHGPVFGDLAAGFVDRAVRFLGRAGAD